MLPVCKARLLTSPEPIGSRPWSLPLMSAAPRRPASRWSNCSWCWALSGSWWRCSCPPCRPRRGLAPHAVQPPPPPDRPGACELRIEPDRIPASFHAQARPPPDGLRVAASRTGGHPRPIRFCPRLARRGQPGRHAEPCCRVHLPLGPHGPRVDFRLCALHANSTRRAPGNDRRRSAPRPQTLGRFLRRPAVAFHNDLRGSRRNVEYLPLVRGRRPATVLALGPLRARRHRHRRAGPTTRLLSGSTAPATAGR